MGRPPHARGGGVGWVQWMAGPRAGPGLYSVQTDLGREKTPASTWLAGVDPPGLLPGVGRG